MTAFLDILYTLSHETGLQLYPDNHRACKLLLTNQMSVQMEIDPSGDRLMLCSMIIETPPGKFRENILKHALIANSTEYPYYGYLCYISKLNTLALYDSFSLRNLTGEFLSNYLICFGEKGASWRNAIMNGQPAPFTLKPQGGSAPFFGIKP